MAAKEYINELFRFAFFPNYQESIKYLATSLCSKEEWDFSDSISKNFSILKNYIEFTFRRIQQEKKIVYTSDNQFCAWNTGLVTENLEDIFALFEKYRSPKPDKKSPYFFKAFLKKSDSQFLRHFSGSIPEVANYFGNPELLLFNPKVELVPDIDHIIIDNKDRFPDHMHYLDDNGIRRHLFGSIEEVKQKVRINYKIAVPQCYNGKIQLLLPLCLTSGSPNPDLALVVFRQHENIYCARTCLTLHMAYINARLIVKPESNWLKP